MTDCPGIHMGLSLLDDGGGGSIRGWVWRSNPASAGAGDSIVGTGVPVSGRSIGDIEFTDAQPVRLSTSKVIWSFMWFSPCGASPGRAGGTKGAKAYRAR